MKKLLLVPMLVITTAQAGGYLDVGLAVADSPYVFSAQSACDYVYEDYLIRQSCRVNSEPLHGVIGTIELGYTMGSYTAYLSHASIINKDDGPGLNILGVKKRFNLF